MVKSRTICARRIIANLLMLLLISACVPPQPETPTEPSRAKKEPQPARAVSQQDAAGITQSTSGSITTAQRELTAAEAASFAQGTPGWIEVSATQVFPNSTSRQTAEKQIQEQLRNEAVRKKVPSTVDISTLFTNITHETSDKLSEQTAWAGFFYSTVSGVITNQNILANSYADLGNNRGFELKLTMKYYVEPVQGLRDPGFIVEAGLQNNVLKTGDELIITLTPSQDCYVYAFNLMADQNIMLMWPNEYAADNRLQAKQTMEIPDAGLRKKMTFKLAPMPGEELSSESVYIVCTKAAVPVNKNLPRIGTSMPVIAAGSQNFLELQRWLTSIPLDQRVETNLVYHVAR